jgi:hypothetical protein
LIKWAESKSLPEGQIGTLGSNHYSQYQDYILANEATPWSSGSCLNAKKCKSSNVLFGNDHLAAEADTIMKKFWCS